MEKIHDTRVIPLDGRPDVSRVIRMGGYFRYADENLRLAERFTRVGEDTLRYEFGPFLLTPRRVGRDEARA